MSRLSELLRSSGVGHPWATTAPNRDTSTGYQTAKPNRPLLPEFGTNVEDVTGNSLAGDYYDWDNMPLDPYWDESSTHYGDADYAAYGDSGQYEGLDDYWNPYSQYYGDADAAAMYANPFDSGSGSGSGGTIAGGGVSNHPGGYPSAFGEDGGAGGMMPPSGMNWWNQQYRRTPTMQNTLDNWLLGSYLNGPSALADQVTREFDSQMNMNADRSHQRGMLNDILGAIGGLNNGTGTRMQGFQDTRTGQSAALPGASPANMGSTTSSITAGAVPQGQIAQAAQTARGGGDYTASNAGLRIPGAAQAELDQRYNTSMANQGNQNATGLDRWATAQNKQLGRASQVAAADQGIDNASWLIGADAQNAENLIRQRNPLLRMAGRIGGLA